PHIEVEDLIQEAALGMLSAVESFDGRNGAALETFLYSVIRKHVLKAITGHMRRDRGQLSYEVGQPPKFFNAKRHSLRNAIKALPPKQKDAVLYCDILGFSQEEAGRILGISHRAVGYRLDDARANLKQILEPTFQK
ncbi:MAG TPA: RNA polymerase sigma factor, partial [Acidithiobacillus sp.]|nr:RNA polymerase sigma factor [Acidithiobacillus sp.]